MHESSVGAMRSMSRAIASIWWPPTSSPVAGGAPFARDPSSRNGTYAVSALGDELEDRVADADLVEILERDARSRIDR